MCSKLFLKFCIHCGLKNRWEISPSENHTPHSLELRFPKCVPGCPGAPQ